ncbi:hypothetical protein [Caballeronia sp. INDeC2]|uniref:hypothetical protein n=1 Tax=Caballeronia sp. INDeC2 TaxID=2921747 RepID=UPI0020298A13|nr:hypothetical protein [Caballeronia sp. INDeC2]
MPLSRWQPPPADRTCRTCGRRKAISDFYRRRADSEWTTSAYFLDCKECTRAKRRSRYHADPAADIAASKARKQTYKNRRDSAWTQRHCNMTPDALAATHKARKEARDRALLAKQGHLRRLAQLPFQWAGKDGERHWVRQKIRAWREARMRTYLRPVTHPEMFNDPHAAPSTAHADILTDETLTPIEKLRRLRELNRTDGN